MEGRFNANVATPIGPVSLTPHVSLSWQYEYLDSSRGIDAQFIGTGSGSFVTTTDNPDRDAAFIDAGLDATVCKNVTVFVDYETQAGQSNYFAQSAQGGVKSGFKGTRETNTLLPQSNSAGDSCGVCGLVSTGSDTAVPRTSRHQFICGGQRPHRQSTTCSPPGGTFNSGTSHDPIRRLRRDGRIDDHD